MQTKEQAYIEFNQNFDDLVYIKKNETALAPSPMKGVERMILERRGDEVARRATTVVTYEPNSSFNAHTHAYGEEFYVLEGTFSDHTGDYPKGWYVRNPVKSAHAPFSKEGTRIFVKLGQMPTD
jgi:mannose-6-phosphate isomerase-like protein (cupin superfamily)